MRTAVAAMLLLSTPAFAAEPPLGATTCSGCHGGGGMIAITGRDPVAMTAQLEDYRSGKLPATLMNRLVKGFSPAELHAIADWLAVQK